MTDPDTAFLAAHNAAADAVAARDAARPALDAAMRAEVQAARMGASPALRQRTIDARRAALADWAVLDDAADAALGALRDAERDRDSATAEPAAAPAEPAEPAPRAYRVPATGLVAPIGVMRWLEAGPPPLDRVGRDIAARLFLLTGMLPTVPAGILLDLATGAIPWTANPDGSVTFTAA
jgi:hypothetical protein